MSTFNPATDYVSQSGKIVHVYEIEAPTIEDALARIPGDFLVHFRSSHETSHRIEIVRTF